MIGAAGRATEGVYRTVLAVGALVGTLDGIGQGALYGARALRAVVGAAGQGAGGAGEGPLLQGVHS